MGKQGAFFISFMLPFCFSAVSVLFRSVWMASAVLLLIFWLVSVLPWCRRHENLWIFIMTAFASVPINLFLLKKYTFWMIFSPAERTEGPVYILSFVLYLLLLSSLEELGTGMAGRLIWKRQCKLVIPADTEEGE